MRIGSLLLSGMMFVTAIFVLSACSPEAGQRSVPSLEHFVKERPIGTGADYWLEMQSMDGGWERVMLVFGYYDSEGTPTECENALRGLKEVNFAKEYRCTPANVR